METSRGVTNLRIVLRDIRSGKYGTLEVPLAKVQSASNSQ